MKIIRKTENVTEEIKELEEALKSGLELASNIIYVKIFSENGMAGGYGAYGMQ